MILLLVASGRGVAVLPDWVVRSTARADLGLVTRSLSRNGRPLTKRLYAATRDADATRPYVAHLIRLAAAGGGEAPARPGASHDAPPCDRPASGLYAPPDPQECSMATSANLNVMIKAARKAGRGAAQGLREVEQLQVR
jgi:hypothetical protein